LRALLLAAGLGTRLQPLTNNIPKCLVPINGRPLLEYWLKNLVPELVESILVNLHYKAYQVEEFIQAVSSKEQVKTIYEKELLGTGGTLLKNRDFFNEEPLMLVHADNLCICDFNAFIKSHENRPVGTEITMMTFRTPSPEKCGIVQLDHRGVVEAFHEKVSIPPGNLANGAVYILEPSVFKFLESQGKTRIDFSTDVLPEYVGRINTFHNDKYHRDIGDIDSLMAAQIELDLSVKSEGGNESWQYCYGNDDVLNARKLMFSLADSLNASLRKLDSGSSCQLLHATEENKDTLDNVMLVTDEVPEDLEVLIEEAKKKCGSYNNIYLLFHKVSCRVSLHNLHKRFGVRGFIIYTY
jgi:mannose-1-phosphate guanylyltransferase